MSEHELRTLYDSKKSFYGNAHVQEDGSGLKKLRSYQTIVAEIKNGRAYVKGLYSKTTGRHIREFLLQNGFEAGPWTQIKKDYSDPLPEEETTPAADEETPLSGHMKSVSMVCAFGQIMGGTQKEKNAWDKRMLGTLPGSNFPDDWDSLPEAEKTRRLKGAKDQIA